MNNKNDYKVGISEDEAREIVKVYDGLLDLFKKILTETDTKFIIKAIP